MSKKKARKSDSTEKTMQQLIRELEKVSKEIEDSQTNNLEEFKKTMKSFRDFLIHSSTSVKSEYSSIFSYFILNSNEYPKFKLKFTNAENFFERIIELDENERILSLSNENVTLENLNSFLNDEFNKLFLHDVNIEISKLQQYISHDNFVMVGCGSLPITLLAFCNKYREGNFIGIDHSAEAIKKAIEIKNKLNIANLSFDIVDGVNYDYKKADTVFVANTVIYKMEILKQIAMSAKNGTKIIIRIPSHTGHLLSEDVSYINIPRIKLLTEIPYDENTDDVLYKLLLLEIR